MRYFRQIVCKRCKQSFDEKGQRLKSQFVANTGGRKRVRRRPAKSTDIDILRCKLESKRDRLWPHLRRLPESEVEAVVKREEEYDRKQQRERKERRRQKRLEVAARGKGSEPQEVIVLDSDEENVSSPNLSSGPSTSHNNAESTRVIKPSLLKFPNRVNTVRTNEDNVLQYSSSSLDIFSQKHGHNGCLESTAGARQ